MRNSIYSALVAILTAFKPQEKVFAQSTDSLPRTSPMIPDTVVHTQKVGAGVDDKPYSGRAATKDRSASARVTYQGSPLQGRHQIQLRGSSEGTNFGIRVGFSKNRPFRLRVSTSTKVGRRQ